MVDHRTRGWDTPPPSVDSIASSRDDYRERVSRLCRIDPQVEAARPRPEIAEAALRPELSLAESLAVIMDGYADRPALGERVSELVTNPATGATELRLTRRIATVTYRELWLRACAIGADLHHHPDTPVRAGDAVATLGFTSGDYTAVELACMRLGTVSVPLPAGAAPANVRPIIVETHPQVLAVGMGSLNTAVEILAGGTSVRRVLVFDCTEEVDAHRQALEAARLALTGSGVALDTLEDAIARGRTLPLPALAIPDAADPDPLSLLIYTSGSTGSPKGAMFPQRLVKTLCLGHSLPGRDHPLLCLHIMPLSHAIARLLLLNTFGAGGTSYFVARPDLSTLLEDFELVRPTELVIAPRICDMLYQSYTRELARRGGTPEVAARLKEELRMQLGGRMVWAGSGSAPLSPELATFMESVLRVPIHDAYGATEVGLVLMDGRPGPNVRECRLADVPELGYFSTDVPHPRGELLLKTDTVVAGYHNRSGVQMLDADGFYHTGDIMAEVEPERFVYIDRRNNVLKLAQGEFVTVSKLETLYVASPLVQQIYVYGNSERAYLLAVVVPTPQALPAAGGDLDLVRTRIAESLRELARDAGLNSYEVPRDFILETEPFTVENGLLSSVRKLVRPKLAEHYGARLEAVYGAISEREADELRQVRKSGREGAVSETVVRAAGAILGASSAPDPGAHFTDLGGDSLSAVELSSLLEEIFQVEVPAGVIVSPSHDLRGVATHIEQSLRAGTARPTFATVHAAGAAGVRATDLTLDKFIAEETLARAKALPRGTGSVRTVLLTGATGYLGRFLCLEWLQRMAGTEGRLVCLVRGTSQEAAIARLQAAMGSQGALLDRFRDPDGDHLRVLPGDIGESNLGVDERTWRELAETVDLIVHPAALVNHVLPYPQLFGPNVAGTAEVIRLALTTRIKPVNYVSTVAAVVEAPSANEGCDIRVTIPERTLDDSYANGYAVSKWAGEVLLREAHDAIALPVAVFRPDMILAHRRFPGQLSAGDMFTRLLVSLLATGIAPRSFYRGGERAHFDGLPVDFTADVITTLGPAAGAGYSTYNVVNPHRDGISLDTFVDWLAGAGHVIKRIDDYATWFSRFETALRALPENQKQRSLLPLLHAFAEPAEARDSSMVPAGRFQAAVRSIGAGPDRHIPQVTPALIRKYVTDLEELGLI